MLANYEQALTIYREVGVSPKERLRHRLGEANTLQGVGSLEENAEKGLKAFLAAQTIYETIGDVYSQGRNLMLFIGPSYAASGQA